MDKSKTIEILDKKNLCYGCGACYNVCPKDAISMQYNSEGFHEPVIDENLCISCGRCEKVCPALHPKKDNDAEPLVYCVKAHDKVRKNSTSGGVFAVLSNWILKKGGYVCGAEYNDSFEVWQAIENTPEGAEKIKKSKYVQSQTGLIFRQIKKLLESGEYVLFSGHPCQVAGLHNYLGKSYDNLFTMDFICHGAPAPMSWKKYLDENFDLEEIESIDFRHKGNHGFKRLHIRFKFKNGKETINGSRENPYYFHFLKNLGLRSSCAHCENAVFPRVSDFTAGDFWGAETYYPELIDNDKGISVLMLNNEHARSVFPEFRDDFALLQKITPQEAMKSNRAKVSRVMSPNRERFFEMLQSGENFNEAVRKNLGPKFDIAVYGNTVGSNYGGVVTYYALYKALLNMGYSVTMIRPPKKKKKNEKQKKPHSVRFCEENIILQGEKPLEKFKDYNNIADTFILGSDQVWNYKLFSGRKLTFYLDFINDDKKKIAYAASFGFEKPTVLETKPELFPIMSSLMKRFDAIAVREADGVNICRDYFDVKAKHVMDPVFLISREEYYDIAEKAKRKPEGRYMAVYSLTPKASLNRALQFGSKTLGIPRVNMSTGNPEKWKSKKKNIDEPYLENVQLEEWLYNIGHSDFVMTDSYHCVCFSIIFRKNFVLVQESWAVSRIKSLLTKLNLLDRWFETPEELEANADVFTRDIDYDAVYEILNNEIEDSRQWLIDAIEKDKSVKVTDRLTDGSSKLRHLRAAAKITGRYKKYVKYLESNKEDFVIMALTRGEKCSAVKPFPFLKLKTKKNKGYVGIYDGRSGKTAEDTDSNLAHASLITEDGLAFACMSESPATNNKEKQSEFIIDLGSGKEIYPVRSDGTHILVYSRSEKKVVDMFCYSKSRKKDDDE